MTNTLRVVLAQDNFCVGDIQENAQRIIDTINIAKDTHGAQLVAFPELAITGYPPEDLLFRAQLYRRVDAALSEIPAATKGIAVIFGFP